MARLRFGILIFSLLALCPRVDAKTTSEPPAPSPPKKNLDTLKAKAEAAALSASAMVKELEKALDVEKSKVSQVLALAKKAKEVVQDEEERLSKERAQHEKDKKNGLLTAKELEEEKTLLETAQAELNEAYQRIAALMLLQEGMRKEYEATSPAAKDVRSLYEDETVQDDIRAMAARLYEENSAMRIAIRDTDELLLPLEWMDGAQDEIAELLNEHASIDPGPSPPSTWLAGALCCIYLWIAPAALCYTLLQALTAAFLDTFFWIWSATSLCLTLALRDDAQRLLYASHVGVYLVSQVIFGALLIVCLLRKWYAVLKCASIRSRVVYTCECVPPSICAAYYLCRVLLPVIRNQTGPSAPWATSIVFYGAAFVALKYAQAQPQYASMYSAGAAPVPGSGRPEKLSPSGHAIDDTEGPKAGVLAPKAYGNLEGWGTFGFFHPRKQGQGKEI